MTRDIAGLVLGPAIKRGSLTCCMEKPARNHDVIREMADLGITPPIGHGPRDVQGFLTRNGFMDRAQVARLLGHTGLLTTEDLW